MGHRRRSERRLCAHRRLPFLAGAAAAAAIGFSVLTPSVNADAAPDADANRQAALILAASAEQATPGAADGTSPVTSPRAASAVAQDQARAQALASAPARPAPAATDATAAPTFPATPDGYRAYAKSKVGAAQFSCLDPLWTRESHWNPAARNPSSTAYGIAQLLDSTWSYTGVKKTSDGFRQVDAGLAYLNEAYPAGPCSAWAHERSRGWY